MEHFALIGSAVVLFCSALIYGSVILAKSNPEVITFFEWGDTPEEIEEDKRFLASAYSIMTLTAVLTALAGIVAALIGNKILYVVAITVPLLMASFYCMIKCPHRKRR